MLSLNLVVAEKIITLRIALVKISWLVVRRRQKDLTNLGNLKPKIVENQKKDLKENENNT